MQREFLVLSLGFAALIGAAGFAKADGASCGARAAILDELGSRYHETRRAIGIAADNSVLELFASEDSGSFTILITGHDGLTCMLASGENFEALNDPLVTAGKGT